jgi:hypothetical protein
MGEEDEIGVRRLHILAAEHQDAEFEAAIQVGKMRWRFSKSYSLMSDLGSIKVLKKSRGVLSVAMPEGTRRPARPLGAMSFRANSAKSM